MSSGYKEASVGYKQGIQGIHSEESSANREQIDRGGEPKNTCCRVVDLPMDTSCSGR